MASCGTWLVYKITAALADHQKDDGFRYGQIATASLLSLAHGTGDAQKTMGVIALALIATGHLDAGSVSHGLPFWVVLTCAIAIALGTYLGGWRIIRTLGKGLVEIAPPQGFSADASSASIILTSSVAGMPLSTTHVATGSILGTGVGRRAPRSAGRSPDGWSSPGHHASRRRPCRRGLLRPGAHAGQPRRCDRHLRGSRHPVGLHVLAGAAEQGRPQQRQRRLGRRSGLMPAEAPTPVPAGRETAEI